MAYADQQMSGNRITALIIVGILHAVVGYALVTGLAYSAIKKIKEVTSAVNIKDEPPPPPPPPPPKMDKPLPPPPPIMAPPPKIQLNVPTPQIQTTPNPPPPPPPVQLPPPPSPPPPPPSAPPKAAVPKGRPGEWVTTNDYPTSALREGKQGVTGFRVVVDASGKVAECTVTRSSGSSELDATACKLIQRRARFTPASDNGSPVQGSYSSSVRWQIPDE